MPSPISKRMAGTSIRATTHGLIPLKILSTQLLSRISAKNVAISSIATNDGSAAPKDATKAPNLPLSLYPT